MGEIAYSVVVRDHEGSGGEENLSEALNTTLSVENFQPFSSTELVEDDERFFPR
jgi:hypothetical protein